MRTSFKILLEMNFTQVKVCANLRAHFIILVAHFLFNSCFQLCLMIIFSTNFQHSTDADYTYRLLLFFFKII